MRAVADKTDNSLSLIGLVVEHDAENEEGVAEDQGGFPQVLQQQVRTRRGDGEGIIINPIC